MTKPCIRRCRTTTGLMAPRHNKMNFLQTILIIAIVFVVSKDRLPACVVHRDAVVDDNVIPFKVFHKTTDDNAMGFAFFPQLFFPEKEPFAIWNFLLQTETSSELV